MTKIAKMSDQENITSTFEQVERSIVATCDVEIGRGVAHSLDENQLVDEMDKVEKCASTGHNYVYNPNWSPEQLAQLREYAEVVGFKGKMLSASQAVESPVVVDDSNMASLASVATSRPVVSAELSLAVGDPFHLADLRERDYTPDKWEKVTPARKLASAPDITSPANSVMPFRGEFVYEQQQQLRVRRGENSLAQPDAIGHLAKEQDTGERLRAENINARAERKAAKTAWQKEALQTAKELGAGALSRGTVFMTGSIPEQHPQSGLELKAAAEELSNMSSPLLPELPDFTDGEKLRKANTDRKTSIQRKAKVDDWQQVRGSTRPSLDDAFADALEAQLRKANIKL